MKSDDLMTLAEACKFLPRKPSGKKVHLSTAWRWTKRGCHGVLLRVYPVGQQLYTTAADVERFVEDLAEERRRRHAPLKVVQEVCGRQRRASKTEADRILREAGILK